MESVEGVDALSGMWAYENVISRSAAHFFFIAKMKMKNPENKSENAEHVHEIKNRAQSDLGTAVGIRCQIIAATT